MLRTVVTLAALLVAGMAPAQDRRDADRRDGDQTTLDDAMRIGGEWAGTYTCVQGATAMRLRIELSRGRELKALMHFFAASDNPDVPEGCFMLTGEFDQNGNVELIEDRWIVQPANYRMIGFEGAVNRDGQSFGGRIIGPPGCTRFALTRARAARPLPPACEAAAK